ncbi:phosphopentomutase [Halocynthiibacter styelae]|uniref:Phosphopentomutase n=1 Tax=Halocynthiibacter styelae TaxID=2761955 RepID=A0A8J7IP15_9RHOB|nr:phosphopentomutase [Paenihalocynthiibacter styelae]MBI1492531.1 phosphopentomutase [Paenihalocynthiibacter styelae]
MTQKRAFLVVMDSVGCGGAPDADQFFNGDLPDTGANTLAHIAQACANGQAEEGRRGALHMPHLAASGIGAAVRLASGADAPALSAPSGEPKALWGAASEISKGKDTPSGHWEIAGVPVPWDWHYFPDQDVSFSADLMAEVARLCGAEGTLCNRHGSGTAVIDTFAEDHIKSGWPICYTSADSVFQIAAHEDHFGLDRLQNLCADIAPTLHAMRVGRVIARPFTGDAESGYQRTGNRHDYAIAPPSDTLCDVAQKAGRHVYAIGKIGDIFSMRGIDENRKGRDRALMGHLLNVMEEAAPGSFTFANFVEFDSLFGHRRDVSGYASALEWFDSCLPDIKARMRDGDLVIFTADHGNDPTWSGTDHTRERVPVIALGMGAGEIGLIGFSDIAASVAAHLDLPAFGPGTSFL